MRIDTECADCLGRLVRQTVDQATRDEGLRQETLRSAMEVLDLHLCPGKVSTEAAGEAQRLIRQFTGNRDPYREWKDREMERAAHLFKALRPHYGDDIRSLFALSLLGNAPDFFKDIDTAEQEMLQPVTFDIDHIDQVVSFLEGTRSSLFVADAAMDNLLCFVPSANLCVRKVLFLADNAGECFFDLPLVEALRRDVLVTYVVKRGPVQNDLTLEDLLLAGVHGKMAPVMTSGTDTPGLDLSLASQEFRDEFASADLIIAKGMANYETLSELPPSEKVFHLLVAKCSPVARSIGVPKGSYVALLR